MPDAPKRMSPERLEELRQARAVHSCVQHPVLRAMLAAQWYELVEEIDALRADYNTVAAECEAWRKAWDERDDRDAGYADPYHSHNTPGQWDEGRPCLSCLRFMAVQAARAATDASGALARHGGGA